MKNRFETKRKFEGSLVTSVLIPVLLFVLIVGLFTWGIQGISSTADEEAMEGVQQAIVRAAVECYAIEGQYPPDITYLERRYGVSIDRNRYIVHYNAFAGNIMPDIRVLDKQDF